MKTNIVLKSKDRVLFGTTIRQETKTGMLNVSDLQEAYTRARILNGWSDKRVSNIVANKSSLERFYYIAEKQGLIKTGITAFMNEANNTTPTKLLKKYKLYLTKGARENKTIWANPYAWVLIAMELNPMLYAEVVTWLADNLILNRIEAGNFYNGLTSAMNRNLGSVDYGLIAKGLNYVVFGKHERGIRNNATEEQLHELTDLQKKLTFGIDMGYIKNFSQLLEDLRTMYNQKNK